METTVAHTEIHPEAEAKKEEEKKVEVVHHPRRADLPHSWLEVEHVKLHQELEDVTDKIFNACKNLKDGELLCAEGFSLEDTMSGFEAMDPKMDCRVNLKTSITPQKALSQQIIKPADALKFQDLVSIFDEFMINEMLWMSGNSIVHTIFTCVYLTDSNLYQDNEYLDSYIQSLFFEIFHVTEMVRSCFCFRDDDFVPPPTHEKHTKYSLPDLLNKITDCKKNIEKDKKKLDEFEIALLARLKLKQNFIEAINQFISEKKGRFTEAEKFLKQALKQFDLIEKTLELSHPEECKCFDISLVNTFPFMSPPKKVPELNKKQAVAQYRKTVEQLIKICQARNLGTILEIKKFENELMADNANVLVRAICEKSLFPKPDTTLLFGEIRIVEILAKDVEDLFPKAKKTIQERDFMDFLEKLAIMTRENLIKQLRNPTRQRRNLGRLFEDLSILITEANFTDENILKAKGKSPQATNTVALTFSISLVIENMQRFLLSGLPLEIYSLSEIEMVFFYLRYIYNTLSNNRRISIVGFTEDDLKKGLANFSEVGTNTKFDKKRKKFSPIQKQMCDEYQFYNAASVFSSALAKFIEGATRQGLIKNILAEQGHELNAYRNRFKLFQTLPFPRYVDFEAYTAWKEEMKDSPVAIMESTKKMFMEVCTILQKLADMDPVYRNSSNLPSEELKTIAKICVMNSMASTKVKMLQNKCRVVLKYDMHKEFPVIDIEKL